MSLPARGASTTPQEFTHELCMTATEDESLIIRKAAELQGWTVAEYIRAAILDRAERDLYEQAALAEDWETVYPATSAEPLTTMLTVASQGRP